MSLPPVILEPAPARPTEYGKEWLEQRYRDLDLHLPTIRDIAKLAAAELADWSRVLALLEAEGVPTAISSGISQGQMQSLINATTLKATYTAPANFYMLLATAAPTSTTTGSSVTEANYTGYARLNVASLMGAASAATPSVATNSGGAITFGNCTAGSNTLAGFMLVDASSGGNGLWYGTLSSVTINTVNTPPTVATSALSLSVTGT